MAQAQTKVRATVKSESANFLTLDLGCQFALMDKRENSGNHKPPSLAAEG
jgi:hypothetical protein